MSIASILARLRSARDAQAAALTAKGVSVPDGAGFEDFPALTEAIQLGDSDAPPASIMSGSVTPSENTGTLTIDVPNAFTHFLIYDSGGTITGHSVKATGLFLLDRPLPYAYAMVTNNSGSSLSSWVSSSQYANGSDEEGKGVFAVYNVSRVTIYDDNRIKFSSPDTPSGTCLGVFLGGHTYRWFAWEETA